jgi:hypothetical protein
VEAGVSPALAVVGPSHPLRLHRRRPFDRLRTGCNPVHAIEYQGGGHFKGAHATAARDAVKKEALRRAGIGYVEVVPGDTPAELRRVVERLVTAPKPSSSSPQETIRPF